MYTYKTLESLKGNKQPLARSLNLSFIYFLSGPESIT